MIASKASEQEVLTRLNTVTPSITQYRPGERLTCRNSKMLARHPLSSR